jgi:hypothetical protein
MSSSSMRMDAMQPVRAFSAFLSSSSALVISAEILRIVSQTQSQKITQDRSERKERGLGPASSCDSDDCGYGSKKAE